jgi:hypothetical protein
MKNQFYPLAIFLFALLGTNAASAATSVPASTLASAHWTLAGSPYQIMGHIIVANGDSLVIDPGVVVEFQGKYKLFCNGKILANGTAAQPILFTVPVANQSTGWLGFRYDNTPSTNGRSIFQYCTIEYGKADITGDEYGGAFYFNNFSNCTLSHCTLRNNYAYGGGGAIQGRYSSPTLKNCTFSNNLSDQGGWGVALYYSASIIDSCHFTGSGIYTGISTLQITNCSFVKCIYEGGISSFADGNTGSGYLTISNNVFDSCAQVNGGGGGAILLFNDKGKIDHNIFRNNVSEQGGGAISCYTQSVYQNTSSTIISNNLFYNNTCRINRFATNAFGGGAIHFSNCSANVINNTFVNNNSDTVGGAIFCEAKSSPAFYNNIVYGNTSKGNPDNIFILDNTSDPDFFNNDLEGGYSAINTNGTPLVGANVGNINAAPMFMSPSTGVYTLATGSPCIDAGNTTGISPLIPATDLGGNVRMTGLNIDMGAYETAGTPLGVSPVISSTIMLVPNPAADHFQLNGTPVNELKSVQIFDLLGRQVAGFENIINNNFDISHIATGVLLVKVNFKNGSAATVKMSKE